jgi:hypothetical protein
MPLAVVFPMTCVWICRERIPRLRQCHVCGYDLTGNVSGVCPECGVRRTGHEQRANTIS